MSAATRARLAELVAAERMDLAEANLLIAAEGSQGLDMASSLAHVEALAEVARSRGVVPALREHGFRGDAEDYDDPRNSFLNEVLARRRGLPIALATLTLAVADRVGAPMAGIGMPGHFLVADMAGAAPVYLDPFDGWRPLTPADCARLVARSTGLPFRAEFLAPVPERAILARTLANLRGSYLRRARPRDALWTVELGLIVSPGDASLERQAVVLLAGVGRYDDAETAATAHLAAGPDPPGRAAVEAHLETLAHLRRRLN